MKEAKHGYCDMCRERFNTENEIYLIKLEPPPNGVLSIINKNETRFRQCKPCYSKTINLIEGEK